MDSIKLEKGQSVWLKWYDSALMHPGWFYDDVDIVPKVIQSIGFVTGVGAEAITITHGQSVSGGVLCPLTVPICCIQEYKILDV